MDPIAKNAILGHKVLIPREQLLVNRSCDVGHHSLPIHRVVRRRRDGPTGDPLCERLSFDKLHDQETGVSRFLEPVKRGDIRMIQSGPEASPRARNDPDGP